MKYHYAAIRIAKQTNKKLEIPIVGSVEKQKLSFIA